MNRSDVKSWRREARQKLLAARAAMPMAVRDGLTRRLIERLRPILAGRPQPISFYWPIKAEPDLKPLMQALDAAGIAVCLPVCTRLGEPLRFRPWRRGCRMERGFWDIPVPADPAEVVPRTLIAPIVGFAVEAGAAYRLGYGGGFFDRTLAQYGASAQAIGIGWSMFRLPTIHPLPHDIPMARIVTESGVPGGGAAAASPVCLLDEAPDTYAGFAAPAEIAEALAALRLALPPERLGLLDYALWHLGAEATAGTNQPARPARDTLTALLPRVRDDALHSALEALRDSCA